MNSLFGGLNYDEIFITLGKGCVWAADFKLILGYGHKKHIVQSVICVTAHYLLSDRKNTEGTAQTDQLHDLLIHTDFYPVCNTNFSHFGLNSRLSRLYTTTLNE